MNELITDAEIAAASEAGEGPKLESWSRMVTLVRALKQQQAEDRKEIERLREVMIQMSEFAIGNSDVCEIIARRLREAALSPKPEATVSDDEETRRAIAEDRAFLHGMESGWNLGVEEDREEFNRRLEAGYKAIREANRELKAKDAEKGQGK